MENKTIYSKETLFNTDLKGKQREWSISVEKHDNHSVIKTIYGTVGGKLICNEKVIAKGKNIGKKNETNHYTQAVNDVNSLWTKKKDSGYLEKGEEKRKDFFEPMLVSYYKDNSSYIKFPCFVQPKLDGVRAIYHNGNFFSRGNKEINTVFNIQRELKLINDKSKHIDILNNCYLDGELFSKELLFEQIVSLVKNIKMCGQESDIFLEYHIFDYYDPDFPNDTYEERHEKLKKIFEYSDSGFLYLIKTDIANNHEEIDHYYNHYLDKDYEGLIVRNSEGIYKEKVRTKDVQKVKPLLSEEFKIVSFKEGEGLEKGCVIWILETNDEKKTFDARPKGKREIRREQFKIGQEFIGKMATVKFQNYTENNKPRFPVFICVRDYE